MLKIFLPFLGLILLLSCQKEVPKAPQVQLVPPQVSAPIPVAHLKLVYATVEHRPTQSVNWSQAILDMALHNKDEIKTGEGSQAEVNFSSGKTSLKIDEKSFVVIWDRSEDQRKIHVVALPEGSLKGSIDSADEDEIEVRTPAGWIQGKKTDFQVSSLDKNKTFKVTVTKGEASVTTAKNSAVIKAGRSVKIRQELKEISNFMEVIPLKTSLMKEKVFAIKKPAAKEVKTNLDKITFSGLWEGEYSVWANGAVLKNDGDGSFTHTFNLIPGLNVITLQVSDPDKKNVEYFIYKVTRGVVP